MSIDKRELRRKMLNIRGNLNEEKRRIWSRQIVDHLIEWPHYREARMIAAYVPFREEADIRPWIEQAVHDGKQVVIPRVHPHANEMDFYRFEGWDKLVSGSYGIMEPDPQQAKSADARQLDMVLVPGVAFDHLGGRLGYGGGYYDRFFARLLREVQHDRSERQGPGLPVRVGIAYSVQMVDHIPMEPFDVPMTYIVTEQGVTEAGHPGE